MPFDEEEITYLRSQPLARLATHSADDQPDVVPVSFEFDGTTFWVGGSGPSVVTTRKFRNVSAGNDQVALVVDDLVSFDPFIARGIRVYGVDDRLFGDVAATLVTSSGNVFSGVCIDTPCGTAFCAEHAAIAAMVTAGEFQICRIVAVWRNESGDLHVLPPCARCREFIRQIDPANLDTEVVLGPHISTALRDLLPRIEWPQPISSGNNSR